MPRPKRSEARPRRARRGRGRQLGSSHTGRRRWPRRLVYAASLLVGIVLLTGAGLFGYVRWRFDQIHKAQVAGLAPRSGNGPFNVLLVGSDSRAFVDTPQQAAAFGAAAATSGQRSDVIIVARVVPALHEVRLLSIPRDTYVEIPGHVANVSGQNRINAAFNNGPDLLVQTIEGALHIPINDYAEVNFPGFSGMVNAVGGIGLDFADPVKDAYSGLNITTTGCQRVNGTQALALVRSRHLYYYADGAWQQDTGSDWSRIQRQDAFFRALLPGLRNLVANPGGMNDFLGALTNSIVIDQSLSEGTLLSLAQTFRSTSASSLVSETLPTIPFTTADGQDVLLPAPQPDEQMIEQFLALGTSPSTAARITGATAPGALDVLTADVLTSAVTVTTVPGASVNPADVVYNNQPEPWNPTPCTP